MPQTQLLTNGDFQSTPTGVNVSTPWVIVSGAPGSMSGWTGSDIEWGRESLYIPGGSTTNRVIEMDGNSGSAITVIQQDFTTSGAVTATLSFDWALRSGVATNVGEGFRVDILDSNGNVVQSQIYLPTSSVWQTATISVPINAAGTYTVRFTELGPNNSYGAVVDNVSLLVCFVAGTRIKTASGPRPVETLQLGDLIWTLDAGYQPLRWIGCRTVTVEDMAADPSLRPIIFERGALGLDQPCRQMGLSPQHRVLRGGWKAELYFGEREVLAPAIGLVNHRTIRQELPASDVTYVHFLFDEHHIVRSDGVLTESFFPSALALTGIDRAARDEVLRLFPELRNSELTQPSTARRTLKRKEAALVA